MGSGHSSTPVVEPFAAASSGPRVGPVLCKGGGHQALNSLQWASSSSNSYCINPAASLGSAGLVGKWLEAGPAVDTDQGAAVAVASHP